MKRYNEIVNIKGKKAFKNIKYPKIPLSVEDLYIISSETDRWDILANQYYSDPSLWWVISIANPQIDKSSYIIPKGNQIRIPTNLREILSEYEKLNS